MSPAWIRTRPTTRGIRRYQVVYRRGGRAWPLEVAGTFGTLREARVRRDLVAGELAAGRNPRDLLRESLAPRRRTLGDWFDVWLTSRIDVDERTRANYHAHWKRIAPHFGARTPDSIDHGDIQEWVNHQANELTPAVVRDYLGTLRQILDQSGVEPNPASPLPSAADRRARRPHPSE